MPPAIAALLKIALPLATDRKFLIGKLKINFYYCNIIALTIYEKKKYPGQASRTKYFKCFW